MANHDRVLGSIVKVKEDLKLYISGFEAAQNSETLTNYGITTVITVMDEELKFKHKGVKYWYYNVLDEVTEDLMTYFDHAHLVIDTALNQDEGVLVHCTAGVSRSATIIIAFLMKRFEMDFLDAFEHLRSVKSDVGPNEGFKYQLRKYQDSGSCLRSGQLMSRVYRSYLLERLSQYGHNASVKQSSPPSLNVTESPSSNHKQSGSYLHELIKDSVASLQIKEFSGIFKFKCKKCRSYLFTDYHLESHSATGSGCQVNELQIAPLHWMKEITEGGTEGTIFCRNLKCCTKMGKFNWRGGVCSCGERVEPYIMIQIKKIDKQKMPALQTKKQPQ